MGGIAPSEFSEWKRSTTILLVVIFIFNTFGNALMRKFVPQAEAAQVTIDSAVEGTGDSHLHSSSQTVFIDDQTGYKFYRDGGTNCAYSKTANGGASWGTPVSVDAQADCIAVSVWYDRWTPGDLGNYIHIVTLDTSLDDLFYNRIDTANGDTLLMGSSPIDVSTNSGNSIATFTAGANYPTITKGTDGTIYTAVADSSDSYVVECTNTCNLAASWTETGTNPMDLANDYNLLVPLASGDIMLINRDISLEDIRSKIWNNANWSGTWTTIDGNATDNTTYDIGMAASVSSTTPGTVYLAYIARNATLGTDDQVRGARYSGSWATTTDIVNSTTRGLTSVAIGIDTANDEVYVAYSGQTTAGTANTANVYWKSATSSMSNWSAENGPVNASADDLYIDLNIASDQRLYATFFDNTDNAIYGDTIADLHPGVHATSSGSQTASANGGTQNVYIGGTFVFYDTYKTHTITGITLTESGTIDGSTDVANVKLFYEFDTTYPYNCASESYQGSETQFGSADVNGFSGANGVSAFIGSTVDVSTTTTACFYAVLDVLDSASNNATIELSIANPTTDVTITGSTAVPATSVAIAGSTSVLNDAPTLMHYHWRNDNGSEAAATSRTGGSEDTVLAALQQGSPARIRLEISNEGGSSTPAMQYRLEYAETTDVCSAATGWTDVGANGGDFDMYNSTNLTDGNDTTNIAIATGGVTDENITFLTPNGGVKDTSSEAGSITVSSTQYAELEYSIIASTTATEGNTYCFRVTDAGAPIAYNQYPRANIAADVSVSGYGSQTASTNIPATNFHIGGAYVITDNTGSHNVTSITITENGTVDGQTDLDNIKLRYDLDTAAPYDCAGETYAGGETQFGATDTDGFSGANGSSTFTGSVGISMTATMCVYVVLDTASGAQNDETVDIIIESPSTNVVVSGGGSVSPSVTRDITGSTALQGPVLTQTHYHFRNDNGSEAAATSMTGGSEDTSVSNVSQTTPVRLRLQTSNEGAVNSGSISYNLEYGAKITTCGAIGSWTDVDAVGAAWEMYDSTSLTDGNDTTNIAVATGGVTDENASFLTPNGAVKDTSNTVSAALTTTQFFEAEFSIRQTVDAGYNTTYCFRLANSGTALDAYSTYPELTTAPERDFEIQRGTFTMAGTSQTITAGVDYVAPSASTSAFVRITNSHHTGAGNNLGTNTQNTDDTTVYITNPSNILNSITFARSATAANSTRVSWEIVEFIGSPGSDNEMIVRSQTSVTYVAASTIATGTIPSTIGDDNDVVVFITGQLNPDIAAANYNTGQSTSNWNAPTDEPVFTRGEAGNDASIVSYAVIEFTGPNWAIQRNEHTYTAAGTTETESITAVNSLVRTFLHTQKRSGIGLNGVDEFGHEVWLSSIGQISYFLQSGATTPSGQTSVAWVIENLQTSSGAMEVTRSNGTSQGGVEPLTVSVSIGKTLDDVTNASIFVNSRAAGTGTNHPRAIAGATIASATNYELWRTDTAVALAYRTEIVEWPTAGLALKQNYYRLYVNNSALDPNDPWPAGASNLGENTVLTISDEPLGEGERIRIRSSLNVLNATFPADIKAFKLQYGLLTTTCSAISESSWQTLGDSASSTVWRGYNDSGTIDGTLLSGNPPTAGDLNLSVSDRAGTFEEANDTDTNAYAVQEGEDIEYDWLIEQNGATADSYYCFRMVEADGTALAGYNNYPQIRTASFTPRTQNWRWYDDESSETPTNALTGSENVAPSDIANGQAVKLRVTVEEIKNVAREDVRFKLQYSEYANFSIVSDVVATSTCTATSTWCYADGGGIDNDTITSKVLSDAESCSGGAGRGCGTHNESSEYKTGFRHSAGAATEYEFTIQSAGPHVNRVYYFRLYDLTQDIPVPANTDESYPSLVTEGASLNFTMSGVGSGETTEGVTLDIDTTPNTIGYGTVPQDTMIEGAHRLGVDTNGTRGYKLLMLMDGDMLNSSGDSIEPVTGTNASPSAWNSGCEAAAPSCLGYHTSDDTLEGGSTRFSAIDTYAQISTTSPDEISYSSQPVANEVTDVVFRIYVRQLQEAGDYEARMMYISVPMF